MAGLLGLGSLSWAGHQVHLSLPINQFLNAGVDPKEIPLPHESRSFGSTLSQFFRRSNPIFYLELVKICGIRGGLDPVTGGLWLTDIAHRHDAIAFLFLVAIDRE